MPEGTLTIPTVSLSTRAMAVSSATVTRLLYGSPVDHSGATISLRTQQLGAGGDTLNFLREVTAVELPRCLWSRSRRGSIQVLDGGERKKMIKCAEGGGDGKPDCGSPRVT